MTNKTRRNISLALLILSIGVFLALIILKIFFEKTYPTLEYIAMPFFIAFFAIMYRNFSLAVKEDKKYGPSK